MVNVPEETTKRVLVVAADFPYPPNHGMAADIWERMILLREIGAVVDLVVTVRSEPTREQIRKVREVVGDLWVMPRLCGPSAFVSLIPFQICSRRELEDHALSGNYDAVILEAEYVASILKNPTVRNSAIILRSHNDESRYFLELSRGDSRWQRKLYFWLESLKFRAFSPRVRKACDLLWFISDRERKDYIRRHPGDKDKSIFLPPHIRSSTLKPFAAKGAQALFIGTLTIPNNADAVQWFVTNVHPLLRDMDGYALTIAGHTGGAPVRTLEESVAMHEGVSLIKDPSALEDLYANAAVFVNPVFRGAGLKLKIIHAIQAGLPVVTTSIGMEGTGLQDRKHVLVANTPEAFAKSIKMILSDRPLAESLVERAQSFLRDHYDTTSTLRRSLASALHGRGLTAPCER